MCPRPEEDQFDTTLEGWRFAGVIRLLSASEELSLAYGDGRVDAPDTSWCQLIWSTKFEEAFQTIVPPFSPLNWGTYAVRFSSVRNVLDIHTNFKAVLPFLQDAYARSRDV